MNTLALLVAIVAPTILVAGALAQTQVPPPAGRSSPPPAATTPGEENAVEGRIESVDPTGTAIRLSDGTKLVTPPGSVLRPGAVAEGMLVVASYREENGAKVLTGLTVKKRGPATR